jgi:hypothetical protein
MRSHKKLTFVLLLFFCQHLSYSQVQTYVYDSSGISVDITKDLNDTLTTLPGTHAKMRLPRYFEPFAYEKTVGFMHKGTSANIIAYEYPGVAFTALSSQMNDSVFIKQGAELLEVLKLMGTPPLPISSVFKRRLHPSSGSCTSPGIIRPHTN